MTTSARRPRVGFVLEQTLGHITHADNLRTLVGAGSTIQAEFAPIEFGVTGWVARVPVFRSNWTVRAGLRARRAIGALRRDGRLDAMFVHTQVPAVLCPDLLRRIPTVVSLDATPIQYDELGANYGHDTSSPTVERWKWQANRLCFARAAVMVTWAAWTKQGLIDRYDVPADKIVVIPPGVDRGQWVSGEKAGGDHRTGDGTVRILFVGGDLARKGGDLLVSAVRQLRAEQLAVEVDLVTRDDVAIEPGVAVHHGLGPNDPALIALYHRADVFCLPTAGDCLPMVLSEAGATGLPLVSTDVGAISEIVRPGVSGLLIAPGDLTGLTDTLRRIIIDADLRRQLGDGARHLVRADYDARVNARRLVELLLEVANRPRPTR